MRSATKPTLPQQGRQKCDRLYRLSQSPAHGIKCWTRLVWSSSLSSLLLQCVDELSVPAEVTATYMSSARRAPLPAQYCLHIDHVQSCKTGRDAADKTDGVHCRTRAVLGCFSSVLRTVLGHTSIGTPRPAVGTAADTAQCSQVLHHRWEHPRHHRPACVNTGMYERQVLYK